MVQRSEDCSLTSPGNEHVVISGKGNQVFPLQDVYLGQVMEI